MSTNYSPIRPMRVTFESYDGPRFQKVVQTSELTGFARTALRNACREGRIKCVKSGRSYYVDVYQLLEDAENGTLAF